MLGKTVKVIIDRPLGSRHPQYSKLRYTLNYGYVEGIMGGDGEEMDAYILGADVPLSEFVGQVIAMIHRLNDNEDKLVVAPFGVSFTREEIICATEFVEKYFLTELEMEE